MLVYFQSGKLDIMSSVFGRGSCVTKTAALSLYGKDRIGVIQMEMNKDKDSVLTIAVIGGGYAGIHAVMEIRKRLANDRMEGRKVKIVLMDKNQFHVRKVLLFKPAASRSDIIIPFQQLLPNDVELVQGTVTNVISREKVIKYVAASGIEQLLPYDIAIMAAGSIVRRPDKNKGGIALSSLEDALQIRQVWTHNLLKAGAEQDEASRKGLLTAAIAGAGISGIETAAELAFFMRREAEHAGINPDEIRVLLVNSGKRLFPQGSEKAGIRLEKMLHERGIQVIHQARVDEFNEGTLLLENHETIAAGLCIWTLGLIPHPSLRSWGLPLTSDGYIKIDSCYRVAGESSLYSIGDCAAVFDGQSGKPDGKTCKEGIAQAARLAKIIEADLLGKVAPAHKSFMDFFCIGLGPEQGMAWTRKWGIDMMITGKLGSKIRAFTWDSASLLAQRKDERGFVMQQEE